MQLKKWVSVTLLYFQSVNSSESVQIEIMGAFRQQMLLLYSPRALPVYIWHGFGLLNVKLRVKIILKVLGCENSRFL